MTIKKKSTAIKNLEAIRKKKFLFRSLLQSVRVTEGLTQVALAKKIGTSKSKICDFEKGRRLPTLELTAKLAKALGHSEFLFISKLIEEQINNAKLKIKIQVIAA